MAGESSHVVLSDCGIFYAGKFVKESQPGRDPQLLGIVGRLQVLEGARSWNGNIRFERECRQ